MNNLTDRQFWLNYWENKTGLIFNIPDSYPFLSLLQQLINNNRIESLLEIGGFPGYYSAWVKKKTSIEVTLLDFVIHRQLVHQLEAVNNIKKGGINIAEADLFKYTPDKKFDLVMSNGLIEHFKDTKGIISKHVSLLSNQGLLFITLPNFRGLNGWFQRTFDKDNYHKHFIECMDLKYLKNVCDQLGLKDIQIYYSGRFMLWLENVKKQPVWVRSFLNVTWLVLKITTRFFPFESKALSPYIVITARI